MTPDPPLRLDVLLAHEPLVRGVARAILRGDAAVDDLVQDTWVVALEHGPQEPRAVAGWLRSIVRHRALNVARERRRRTRRERASARAEAGPDVADIAEREVVRRRLVEAILAEREPYRTALLLRFYEEMPPRRIAARLGLPVETVKTHVKRGLARLRQRLRAEADDAGWSPRRSLLGLAGIAGHEGPAALLVAGGALMGSKSIGAVVVAVLLLVAAAWWWGRDPGTGGAQDPAGTAVLAEAPPRIADAEPGLAPRPPAAVPAPSLPEGALRAVVVDPSNTPLAGVSVRIVSAEQVPSHRVTGPEPALRGDGFVAESDADGAFVLAGRPADAQRVMLLKPGYLVAAVEPAVFDAADSRITMLPGRVLEGRVRGTEGDVVPWARLMAVSTVMPQARVNFGMPAGTDGSFRFRFLPAAYVSVHADARGHDGAVRSVAADEPGPIEFVLRRTALLVRVVDAETRAPIENAGAILQTADGSFRVGLERATPELPSEWLMLDSFKSEHVFPAASGELHVVAPGYASAHRTMTRDPTEEPPRFVVALSRGPAMAALAGEVRGATGVTIEVRVPRPLTWVDLGDATLPVLSTVTVDPDGSFAIPGLPAGVYRLVLRAQGAAAMTVEAVAPDTDLRIDLSPAGSLRVEVVPPGEAWVHLEQPGGRSHWCRRTDGSGSTIFDDLPSGAYRATVVASESTGRLMPWQWRYVPTRADVEVAAGRRSTTTLAVPQRRPFTLHVVDENGADRDGVRVSLTTNPGSYSAAVVGVTGGGPLSTPSGSRAMKDTGADGRAVFDLFAEVYGVELTHGTQKRSTWFHFEREGPDGVTIVFPRASRRLVGRLLDASSGEGIADRRVEVVSADAVGYEMLGHGATDADGRFEVQGVPAQRVAVMLITNLDAGRRVLSTNPYGGARVELDLTAGAVPELTVRLERTDRWIEALGSVALTVAATDAASGEGLRRGFVSVEVLREGVWVMTSHGRLGEDGRTTEAVVVPRGERYRMTILGGFEADPPYARNVVEGASDAPELHLDVAMEREGG